MDQLQLNLLGCVDAPGAAPVDFVAQLRTYREAVVACWSHRRIKGMTNARLAELTGMRPSHISDYLAAVGIDSKGKERRDLPAKHLPKFQAAAGNTIVTQWLAMQSERALAEALREAA